ncbi:unnamed protein product [Closterium sp. NIES-53]
MVTRANDIRAANTTPRRPTLSKPLTKLLGRRGLAPTLLVLPLASSKTLSPTATTPTAATTATPTAVSTAAINATTPIAATTSTAPTTSTATHTTTPAAIATTPATLALAAAVLRTSRSGPDVHSTRDVSSSSSRGVGGSKGEGEHPSKKGVHGVPQATPTSSTVAKADSSRNK